MSECSKVLACRFGSQADVPLLAEMNERLIRDEGHRCGLTKESLEPRMSRWLGSGYTAVIFSVDDKAAGYALWRSEPEYIYLRQFYVEPEFRRKGIGESGVRWLINNAWNDAERLRLDVLVSNGTAYKFWSSIGLEDYCITMELEIADRSNDAEFSSAHVTHGGMGDPSS